MFAAIQLTWGLVSEPRTYLTFLTLKRWQLCRFYSLAVVALSILWCAQMFIRVLPLAQDRANQAATEFVAHYPDNLILDWNGQQLTLDPSQTYTINYPSFVNPSEADLANTLAIYQPADLSEDATPALNTFFLITPSTLWIHDQQGWSNMPLSTFLEGFPTFNLTKDQLAANLQSWITSNDVWNVVRVTTVVASIWWVAGTTLISGIIQYVLAYLVLLKIYDLKMSGKQLARLILPITIMASGIQMLAELIYADLRFDLFIITFWILLFLVIQAWMLTSQQKQTK